MIVGLVIMVFLLLGSEVLARWSINLLGEYGFYDPSLKQIYEFNRSFESWTKYMGVEEFAIEPLRADDLYSISGRLELAPRWELGLNVAFLKMDSVFDNWRSNRVLAGSGEKPVPDAYYNLSGKMTYVDLLAYYRVNPTKRFSPFLGAGIGRYGVEVNGCYTIREGMGTEEYRYLLQSFSASDSVLGYIATAGIDYNLPLPEWGLDVRIGLEMRYHQLPVLNGQFDHTWKNGYDSYPVEPSTEVEVDMSGLQGLFYAVISF